MRVHRTSRAAAPILIPIAALMLLVGCSSAQAAVVTFTSQAAWLATVAPPVLLNFDDLADGTAVGSQYQALGVTFSPFNGGLPTAVTESNPHSPAQTLAVDPSPLTAGGGLALNFSAPTAGFGFWFNDSQFAGNTVALYGPAGQWLASYELPYPHPTEWLFVGFRSSLQDIARVEVAFGAGDRVTLDDVMFTASVPEPPPVLLLLTAGGLLAWMRRRPALSGG